MIIARYYNNNKKKEEDMICIYYIYVIQVYNIFCDSMCYNMHLEFILAVEQANTC